MPEHNPWFESWALLSPHSLLKVIEIGSIVLLKTQKNRKEHDYENENEQSNPIPVKSHKNREYCFHRNIEE